MVLFTGMKAQQYLFPLSVKVRTCFSPLKDVTLASARSKWINLRAFCHRSILVRKEEWRCLPIIQDSDEVGWSLLLASFVSIWKLAIAVSLFWSSIFLLTQASHLCQSLSVGFFASTTAWNALISVPFRTYSPFLIELCILNSPPVTIHQSFIIVEFNPMSIRVLRDISSMLGFGM